MIEQSGRQLFVGLLKLCLGQLGLIVFTFIGIRLVTEEVSPSTFGWVSITVAFSTLLKYVWFSPLEQGAIRFYVSLPNGGNANSYYKYFSSRLVYGGAVAIILGCVLFLLLRKLGYTQYSYIFLIFPVYGFLVSLNSHLNALFNAEGMRGVFAFCQVLEPLLKYGLTLFVALFIAATYFSVILAFSFSLFILLLFQLVIFRRGIYLKRSHETKKGQGLDGVLEYSWPFLIFGMLTWFHITSDKFFIEYFLSAEEVGKYAILYQIGFYPVSMVLALLVRMTTPIVFSGKSLNILGGVHVGPSQVLLIFAGFGFFLVILAFLISWFYSEEIFEILVAEEYREFSVWLWIMVIAGGMYGIGNVFSVGLMQLKKTKWLIFPKLSTAMLGVVLNYFLVQSWGVSGVIFSMAIAFSYYMLAMSVLYFLVAKMTNTKRPF